MNINPTGWSCCNVRDLSLNIQYGYTASAETERVGPRFLRISDIQEGKVQWPSVPFCKIDKTRLEQFTLDDGDIVFARTGGTVGKSFLISKIPEPTVFASYLIRVSCANGIDPKYLYWFFQSAEYWEQVGIKKGGLQGNVNAKTLGEISLRLAPTNEQNRIAEKIEALFDELAVAIESLMKARTRLSLYRMATLDRLTNGSSAKSGEQTTLSEVIDSIGQGWSPRCENIPSPTADEWGVIKTTAIQPGYFDGTENKKLPTSLDPRPHLELQDGDLLITRAGPRKRVGVASLVKKPRRKLILCDKAYRLGVCLDKADPAYLEAVLNSPSTQQAIEKLKSGINDSGLNLTQNRFLSLKIYLPDLQEQREIVAEIDAKMSNISALDAQLEEDLSRANSLRQSILKRAFTGKLVEQDTNDEPASVLLERIKAEKEEAEKSKRKRKA